MQFSVDELVVKEQDSISTSWQTAVAHENSNTDSQQSTLTWTQGNDLGPGKGVDCQAVTSHGEGDFPCTTTVTLYLVNGKNFNYQEKGTLHAVQYSKVDASCREIDHAGAPGGYDQGGVAKNGTTKMVRREYRSPRPLW